MICWILNNFDEARIAFKKLFYNGVKSTVVFENEEDFIFCGKSNKMLNAFREKMKIPDDIKTDSSAIDYIDQNIEKIISKEIFPCSMIFNSCINNFELIKINENIRFPKTKYNYSFEEIKKLFEKYNMFVMFFNSDIYIPITFEELKIIFSKTTERFFLKKGQKYIFKSSEISFVLTSKEKE